MWVGSMNSLRREDAQSFSLRFWFERSLLVRGRWRGMICCYQQGYEEKYIPIKDPEEAFEIVRIALARVTPGDYSSAPQAGHFQRIWRWLTRR
jgi:hypothetical protein